MKRFLLSCLLLSILGLNLTHAQTSACGVKNLTSLVINRTSNASCSVTGITFNLEWDQDNNGGNVFTTLHIWLTKHYPAYVYSTSNPPTTNFLTSTNAFGTVVLKQSNGTFSIETTYLSSTTNVLSPSSIIVTNNADGTKHIKLTGITKSFGTSCPVNATESLSIKADVWSSQQPQNKTVQCSTSGLTANLDDPIVAANFYCTNPRQYDVKFTNNGTSTLNISYNVYLDKNGNGVYDGVGTGKDLLLTSTPVTVPALSGVNSSWYSGRQDYLPFSNTLPDASKSLFIVAQVGVTAPTYSYSYSRTILLENSCATLPVKFTFFNATRKDKNVELKWETATEENNKGFYIQRNVNGTWKDIAFVFSAATDGNSNSLLSYSYKDVDAVNTVAQYRILQVDIDGKGKYSEIRSVRGLEQAAKVMVFPNPSTDKVNVLFENAQTVRDVKVTDIAGRMVKQYNNVTSNSISIENLKDGFYNIQVTDRHTGATTVEKAVIKKR